jgi:hypothetical protein
LLQNLEAPGNSAPQEAQVSLRRPMGLQRRREGIDIGTRWQDMSTAAATGVHFDIVPVATSRRPLRDVKHPDHPDGLHE